MAQTNQHSLMPHPLPGLYLNKIILAKLF